ncbi:MAG: carboxypeptidase M32 [Candidatus Korarchaeota archaeon]|nr:carboxypeptidase M32 [Candidatus Korarchaeota archaeon]NIU82316.1 hypothetical protein [Candidatus Thorarchaeota archaeon]NIW12799.1 hypothetical protein [Candidatus Thorarchaeota archaeon]NIW51000.1 hypothetical protein [Candidatus Korarchaeota archaeon]
MDKFEPGLTAETIAELFTELKHGLQSIIDKCASSPNPPDPSLLHKQVPITAQRQLAKSLANFLEYDVASEEAGGRIDETEHPFTTGYYDDVRITTNYHEEDFTASFFSVLHEGGHAIHGRNQKREWMFQLVGSSASAGFSESQARFVENIVGRSKAFWRHYFPKFQNITNGTFSDIDLDTFFRAINVVQPSKIRIKADEVTYCLHIVIRFEIERKLFAGDIAVAELPTIWNQKYEDYLGVRIEDDAEGVLQDTHWASGLYGYFPSYALGNIYSGQLLDSLEEDLPEWRTSLTKGDFHPIKNWLIQNVYQHGALYDPEELISKITGEDLTVQDYLEYLQNKYFQLYDF